MSTSRTKEIENREDKGEIEIDLGQLFQAILGKLWMILIAAFGMAVIALLITKIFITPIYESSTKIYVLNKTAESANSVTASDLQVSTQLTKDYQQLILSRTVLEKVIEEENLDLTYDTIKAKIAVSNSTDTRVLEITVSDQDPKVAQDIANCVRKVSAEHIQKVMDIQAVNTVDEANLATNPSKPSTMKNTLLGGLLGGILAIALVVLQFMLDDRIRTVEDVEQYLGLGVLGTLPATNEMNKPKQSSGRRGQEIQRKKRR